MSCSRLLNCLSDKGPLPNLPSAEGARIARDDVAHCPRAPGGGGADLSGRRAPVLVGNVWDWWESGLGGRINLLKECTRRGILPRTWAFRSCRPSQRQRRGALYTSVKVGDGRRPHIDALVVQ